MFQLTVLLVQPTPSRMTTWKSCRSILLLAALLCVCASGSEQQQRHTDDFALELLDNSDISVAKEIAKKHGFDLLHHAHQLGNVFHLRHRGACKSGHTGAECARDAAALVDAMSAHPRVLRAVHQSAEEVEKKHFNASDDDDDDADDEEKSDAAKKTASDVEDAQAYKKALSRRKLGLIFNDPHFRLQWHLHNTGQFKGVNPGLDLNLLPAWNKGFHGSGVVVSVVDDGVDVSNPDLSRYDPLASADLNNLTNRAGVPIRAGRLTMKETHGTACAGEIGAAANNSFCGVGIAFNASLGGIRILDGIVTDLLEAYAILHNNHYISIYSCSWGPKDNGFKLDKPKLYTARALRLGTSRGRSGKGSVYVMASGNGGQHGDNCGADGFVNSPYTVAVGALNIYGRTPLYGESCSAIHVAAPVGGRDSKKSTRMDPQITTTMVNGGCFNQMSGTSAATPMVSACVALALQANPALTWRDVQHLLARSARLPTASGGGAWQVNGAGRHVSHHAGFGLLDCARLVFNAQTWPGVPAHVVCDDTKHYSGRFRVPAGKRLTLPFKTDGCGGNLTRLEHALVTLSMRGMRRGDTELWLESPAGTKARLLGPRPRDNDRSHGIRRQAFLSLLSWDEDPRGRWLLHVRDRSGRPGATVTAASLRLMGSGGGGGGHHHPPPGGRARARWLTPAETVALFRRQRMEAAAQEVLHPELAGLSRRLGAALDDDTGEQMAAVVKDAHQLVAREAVTEWDLKFLLRQIDTALL